jgi:hypothetical protein
VKWRVMLTGWVLVLVLSGVIEVESAVPYVHDAADRFVEHGPSATVTDLHGVEQLRSAFNDDAGVPRLILLLSPT